MLSFPVVVNEFLSFAAGKSVQVIDLLKRGNVGVRYHSFERSFPGVKKRRISIKCVGMALWKVLPS